jgi:curved DNA-binding protein CbpA
MTHYDTLGISKHASAQEIKTAYRNLAKQYHPDKTQGNKILEEKFKLINHAYDILSDIKKKANYDFIIATYNDNRRYTYPPASPPTQKQKKPQQNRNYTYKSSNRNYKSSHHKEEGFEINENYLSLISFFIFFIILISNLFKDNNKSNNVDSNDSIQFSINSTEDSLNILSNYNYTNTAQFAIEAREKEILINPNSIEPYIELANIYLGIGYNDYKDSTKAHIYYTKAISNLEKSSLNKEITKSYIEQLLTIIIENRNEISNDIKQFVLTNLNDNYFSKTEIKYYNSYLLFYKKDYKESYRNIKFSQEHYTNDIEFYLFELLCLIKMDKWEEANEKLIKIDYYLNLTLKHKEYTQLIELLKTKDKTKGNNYITKFINYPLLPGLKEICLN